MADTKISALTAASALAAADIAPLVQGGANVKATVQQIVTAATGSTAFPGETLTTSKPAVDLAQTWNASGVAFTGVKFNATDTASAAGSLLMDLQVGGASRFRVGKGGTAFVTDSLTISSSGIQGSASLVVTSGRLQAQGSFDVSGYQIFFGNGWCSLSGSNSTGLTLAQLANGTGTFVLQPNSSGIVEQRTGVNAQTFRLYGTFTDASNSRRLALNMTTGGVASIKPEGLGTGSTGNVLHISGLPDSNPGPGILWNDGGTVKVGT